MAKYAISEEGVSQLQKLSKGIISNTENIYEAGNSLKNNISSLGEGLGVYEDEILDLVNHNQATLQSNREVFKQLSDSIIKKADEICDLMGFGFQNSTNGHQTLDSYQARRDGTIINNDAQIYSTLPLASTLEHPKILTRDKDEAIAQQDRFIQDYIEVLRDDLNDKGITDPDEVNRIIQEKVDETQREFYNDLYGNIQEKSVKCMERLSEYFNEDNWNAMGTFEREDALNTLAIDAGDAFRTEVLGVRFFRDTAEHRGYFSNDGYLYLNEDVLTNPTNRLDALDTVFHEGRHAMQQAAIYDPNKYSVERKQADIWKDNFNNYIQYENNRLGYFRQPIEADARGFAESVLSGGGIQ